MLRVLAAEAAQPTRAARKRSSPAQKRAASLLAEWVQHVRVHGVLSRPSFATSVGRNSVPYIDDDDVAEVKEALLYPPRQEMWQLCSPGDLSVLNTATALEVVRFASRLNKDALAGTLPGERPV